MYSKEPVWLSPEQIIRQNEEFCFVHNLTERIIVKLFDAHLLRGIDDRNTRKILILEESFELLQGHIRYMHYKQAFKQKAKAKRPRYLNHKFKIYYDSSKNWYTPKEILETYTFLKQEKKFNTEFIGELSKIGLLVGTYQQSQCCYHVTLSSFVELIKYMNYTLAQSLLLPPPSDEYFS